MSRNVLKIAAVLLGATALAAAAMPASADTVTMQARNSGNPGATSSADYVAAWNAVLASQPLPPPGYADQVIGDWDGTESNSFTGGGATTDLAYHDQAIFNVSAGQVGVWDFRLGIDFGFGGTLIVDGVELDTHLFDTWWNYDTTWSNPSQFLFGSLNLGAGVHVLDAYGFEGCCDGGTIGQFRSANSNSFQDFKTTGVPEPGAWSLMILGFGAAGAALRRRRAAMAAI